VKPRGSEPAPPHQEGFMRHSRVWITIVCCLFALAVFAWGQARRKPGLWEITSTMTFQQSPMPQGMQAPASSPFGGGTHTVQVCLTQAMIDRYGAPMPANRSCKVTDVVLKATSMTGSLVCIGMMSGTGTVESNWSEPDHAKGKVHFVGTMQMGPNSRPVEWTSESESTYKGADCGSVQPVPMPADK
jgi:Protein of unknown function (DUF3617)